MKKIVRGLLCVLLLLLAGCSSSHQTDAETTVPTMVSPVTNVIPNEEISLMQMYMDELVYGMYKHEANVYEFESGFHVNITMEGGMVESTFADFVIDGTQTLREILPKFSAPLNEFSIVFTISDPYDPSRNGKMLWFSEDLETGILSDNSNGHNYFIMDATLNDIAELYEYTISIEN